MSGQPKLAPPRQKKTAIAPCSPHVRQRKSRRYHLADDVECTFDYELPEWMGGLG